MVNSTRQVRHKIDNFRAGWGLGGQHPSCVGLSKNKKKGENMDAQGEERNNKKQEARKEMGNGGGGQQSRCQKMMSVCSTVVC